MKSIILLAAASTILFAACDIEDTPTEDDAPQKVTLDYYETIGGTFTDVVIDIGLLTEAANRGDVDAAAVYSLSVWGSFRDAERPPSGVFAGDEIKFALDTCESAYEFTSGALIEGTAGDLYASAALIDECSRTMSDATDVIESNL